jgi:hypothetical protein
MQVRTYPDGTLWLRWLASAAGATPAVPRHAQRATAAWNCFVCAPNDPAWSRAPAGLDVPTVELIYDCEVCGSTTLQGRLGPAV